MAKDNNKNQQPIVENKINSGALKKEVVLIKKGHTKVVSPKDGMDYQIAIENSNQQLATDFSVIAQKKSEDLIVLLEDNTSIIFDDYFLTCVDLSCVVSLPAAGILYHVADGQSKILSDGTKILYVYGDKSMLKEMASGENALLSFLDESHTNPDDSSWSLSTIGAGVLGVAAAVGGGSSGGGDSTTKFSISGDISAGQVIEGQDLKITVRDKDGDEFEADEFEASIEDDGSFSIQIKKEYADYLIVEVTGGGSEKDYKDEGDGDKANLSTLLRVVVKADGKTNITAMLNPLTEIIVRKVLDGESTLEAVGDDVADNLATANTAVGKAFNAEGVDINSTKPAVVNADSYDSAASAGAKALGRALAGISGMENQDRNGKETYTMAEVLGTLTAAIDDNGVLTEKAKADFLAGLGQANEQDDNEEIPDTYTKKFESIIFHTGIKISDDTAYAELGNTNSDFLTQAKKQTITASLNTALAGDEVLWGSVDSGANWDKVTVSKTSISWDISLKEWDKQELIENQTLPKGQYIIQFAITADTVSSSEHVAGNVKGNIAKQSYILDTTAPNIASIRKVMDDDNKTIERDATTNITQPTIRIDLNLIEESTDTAANTSGTVNANAKEGDKVQVVEGDKEEEFDITGNGILTKEDIKAGYKDVTLSVLSTDGDDNKDYKFKVRIIDKVSNESALSTEAYVITYDGTVENLTLELKEDTGASITDNITNDKTVVISNIEKDAKVEYILDGTNDWKKLDLSLDDSSYDSDKGTAEITLNEDTEYAASNIKVRQTDSAGNISGIVQNTGIWTIDNTAAVYEPDDKLNFIRIFENDDSNTVIEVCITLTFDEEVVKPKDFNKDYFSIKDGVTNEIQEINRVNVNDEDRKEVKIYILNNVDSNTIKLSYTSVIGDDDGLALQDKAGNRIAEIEERVYTLDDTEPSKAAISHAIIGDKKFSSGETTNKNYISIRVSLAGTDAEKDDRIQVLKNDDDIIHKHSQYVTLDEADISRGYKDVSLSKLTAGENSSDKDYSFQARIIDQTGNKGALSNAFLITYDGSAETLTLELDSDTGTNTTDGITSDNQVIIGNIEKDVIVKYTLTSGAEWVTITAGHEDIKYTDDIGTLTIDLEQNKVYGSSTIQAQQIDEAGNESDIIKNSQAWTTDDRAVEYDNTEDEKIFRVKNDDTDAFETHVVLTFTENVFKLPTFDKDSFSVFIGDNPTKSDIKSIDVNGEKITIIINADIQGADTNELKLFYTQSDVTKALQDKAGNVLTDIGSATIPISFTFDKEKPDKPVIESVIDDSGDSTGEVAENAITDDSTLTVKTTFSGMVKDDDLEYCNTENGEDTTITTVVLTQSDIDKGYKITTLFLDSSAEGKDYVLSAKLIDQAGNISDSSDVKNFTVDARVKSPTIKLIDTGKSSTDKVTSSTKVEVSDIEKDAWWEYSVDGGDNWTTYDFTSEESDGANSDEHRISNSSRSSSNSSDKPYSFYLMANTTYEYQDIRVRQTDKAKNEITVKISSKVIIDDIAPEYQSIEASGNTVILIFSEDLHDNFNTTSSSATGRFEIENNTVNKVETEGNKVYLTVSKVVEDVSAIKISYTKPTTGSSYYLQDIAGNQVENSGALKIGTDEDDIILGTSGIDTLIGGSGDDIITGNQSDDRLTGGGGIDTFDYNAITDGDDTITDFTIGDGGDKLDLKDLLSYSSEDDLGDFLTVTDGTDGGDVTIAVDADGDGSGTDLTITLSGIGTGALTLDSFETTHNLIVL